MDYNKLGRKEMAYRYECKVESFGDELAALSDTVREEITRLDDRFALLDREVKKIDKVTNEKFFNLETQAQILR